MKRNWDLYYEKVNFELVIFMLKRSVRIMVFSFASYGFGYYFQRLMMETVKCLLIRLLKTKHILKKSKKKPSAKRPMVF